MDLHVTQQSMSNGTRRTALYLKVLAVWIFIVPFAVGVFLLFWLLASVGLIDLDRDIPLSPAE
jgi:hypothetical protein